MTEPRDPAIDAGLARALDAFAVPPLPADFAARLEARALALPEAAPREAEIIPLPRSRRAPPQRWVHRSLAGLGVVAAGLVSLSAAAAGYLGEPINHAVHRAPVIGHVIEKVIPEHRRHAHPPVKAVVAVHPRAVHAAPPPPIAAQPLPIATAISPDLAPVPLIAAPRPGLAARVARRRALGLPIPPRMRAAMATQRAEMAADPALAAQVRRQRAAALARLRERLGPPPADWAQMSPVERRAWRRERLRETSPVSERPVLRETQPMTEPSARSPRPWQVRRQEMPESRAADVPPRAEAEPLAAEILRAERRARWQQMRRERLRGELPFRRFRRD